MNNKELYAHINDPARLAALRAVALLDTPTEEAFDRLTSLAAKFVDAPIALVTLVDADRQFFKSCIGLPEPLSSVRETPLSDSFCKHNRIPGKPLLVEDARTHPLFRSNPAIRELGVIAYLGIPLVTSEGYVLGSFCVIDSKPRPWSLREITVVQDLAKSVMTEIELRTEIAARKQLQEQRDDLLELIELLREEVTASSHTEDRLRILNQILEQRVEKRTTELQEKQSQFLHSEKLNALGQLSASIAHEFNNPLQSITTVLRGLYKYHKFEEEDRVLLGLAIDECLRMKNLIQNLQEFNRPSSGKRNLIDVNEIINSLLILSKMDLNRKHISTKLDFEENLPRISAIPDQIKQVILNLLNNAVDACGPKNEGLIEIKTWREDRRIAFSIRDNGIGMDDKQLSRIFQPFYTTKPIKKGTGLGLSICHGIVQDHKGQILVESEPGKGSTFTVLLPVKGEAE